MKKGKKNSKCEEEHSPLGVRSGKYRRKEPPSPQVAGKQCHGYPSTQAYGMEFIALRSLERGLANHVSCINLARVSLCK